MTFRVGQKVVCVDGADQKPHEGDATVVLDAIYTVREFFDWFGLPAMRVAEITNPGDRAYHARRFRPIVEHQTDISVFTEILRTTKAPQLDEVQS